MSEHKLYQSDCLEVMKNIPDRSISKGVNKIE